MPSADELSQALVVSVSQYQYLGSLRKAQDAQGVRDVLTSPDYCGYPAARVTIVEDDEATRDNIINALRAMCERAKSSAARTFFYFSGHGGQGPDGASYILPVDARKDDYPHTAISARDLSQLLDQCDGELTVILDCCRAAGMARDASPGVAAASDSDDQDLELAAFTDSLRSAIQSKEPAEKRTTKRALIASSCSDGKAFRSPEVPYSILTGHMLDRLRGAEAETTGGGNVTIDQLFAYLEKHVRRDSGTAQRPMFIAETESFYVLTDYPQAVRRKDLIEKDVFISYDRDDLELEDWIQNFFQPELENNGLSIWKYNPIGDIKLYARNAIARSRYAVVVLTRSYFKNHFEEFSATMALTQAIKTGTRRFIPVMREMFDMSDNLDIDAIVPVDLTPQRRMQHPRNMKRLIERLKTRPNECQ